MSVIFKKEFIINQFPNVSKEEIFYDISTLCDHGVLFLKESENNNNIGLFFELLEEKYEEYKENPNILIGVSSCEYDDISFEHITNIEKKDNCNTIDYGFPNACNKRKNKYRIYVYLIDNSCFDLNNNIKYGLRGTWRNICYNIKECIMKSKNVDELEVYSEFILDPIFYDSFNFSQNEVASLYNKHGHIDLLENIVMKKIRGHCKDNIPYSDKIIIDAIVKSKMYFRNILIYLVRNDSFEACRKLFDFYGYKSLDFNCEGIYKKIIKRNDEYMFEYLLSKKVFPIYELRSNEKSECNEYELRGAFCTKNLLTIVKITSPYKALDYAFSVGDICIIRKLISSFDLTFTRDLLLVAKTNNHAHVLEYFQKNYGVSV